MAGFMLRRTAASIVLVALAAALAYLLAAATLDPRSVFEGRNPRPPEQVVDARLTELNLNDHTPLPVRLGRWVEGVAHGDLGRTVDGASVGAELDRRVWVSVRLLVLGMLLGSAVGVAVGYLTATRQYGLVDRTVTVGSFAILATPVFVLAILLQVGAERINELTGVHLFEWVGEYTPGDSGLADRVQHLVLPTLTVALVQVAVCGRYQRNLMLDVLRADYVRTAMAKGLRRRTALRRHALRTALTPMSTYFAYNVGLLLLGAAFTEKIFGWHGMGEWLIDSIGRGDVNAVAAYDLFAAGLVLAAGLLADLGQALLDPRLRTVGAGR
jgi:peptide/nickel transport system permease protein